MNLSNKLLWEKDTKQHTHYTLLSGKESIRDAGCKMIMIKGNDYQNIRISWGSCSDQEGLNGDFRAD